jgi:nitrate/nitrite transporter NarK
LNTSRYRFVIQAHICLIRMFSGGIWASAGPLLPFIVGAFGLSRGNAAWYASVSPLAIIVLTAPLGLIASRISPKKLFAFGALLQAAGIVAPLCTTYFPLLLARGCFALGAGITFPLIPALAAEWFPPREVPLVNGITLGFNSLGNALAFLFTVPIATAISWNTTIAVYGAGALLVAISWMILGKDRAKARKVEPVQAVATAVATAVETATSRPQLTVLQALTQRPTILMCLATLGCWGLGNSLGAWLPSYYSQVFHMPLRTASSIPAIMTFVGIFASITGGILPLRVRRRKPFLVIPGMLLGVFSMIAVSFNNMFVICGAIACYGFLNAIYGPTLFTIPYEIHKDSPRIAALVAFTVQIAGNVGNFIAPLMVGYLTDITGSYLPGFIISALLSLLMLMAGLMLPETGEGGRARGSQRPPRLAGRAAAS